MLDEKRLLLISQFGIEGYSLLARIACRHPKILWISSNPYIPWKMLSLYTYDGDAKVLGFSSRQKTATINPMNLNELGIAVSSSIERGHAVVFSCISELLMFHRVERVYYFLSNIMDKAEEGQFIGFIIEGAQDKKDELLIATLFDAVFRLKKRKEQVLLLPELYVPGTAYTLRCEKGLVDIEALEEVVANV